MQTLAFRVADEYRDILRGKLTEMQFDSVLHEGIHPENYLDANMTLEEAFIKVMGRESDLANDSDIDLLNDSARIFYNDFCLINSNII